MGKKAEYFHSFFFWVNGKYVMERLTKKNTDIEWGLEYPNVIIECKDSIYHANMLFGEVSYHDFPLEKSIISKILKQLIIPDNIDKSLLTEILILISIQLSRDKLKMFEDYAQNFTHKTLHIKLYTKLKYCILIYV